MLVDNEQSNLKKSIAAQSPLANGVPTSSPAQQTFGATRKVILMKAAHDFIQKKASYS